MNVVIAVPAVIAAMVLLTNQVPAERPKLDVPGAVAVSLGLFLIVFGFSQAEPRGWTDWETLGSLIVGVIILVAFVTIERRSTHPLLPLRIVLDRNRGGSYLSVLISGAGLFGVFLFLTYYLQKTLGYSPVTTGLAFLPMVAMIVIGSTTSNAVLLPRFGPKPLVPTGMVLASIGMVLLAQLGVHSTYAGDILPALLVIGLGLGLIFAPSINTATLGVSQDDAGVASATVNSCQQVGGSIGTAFLNTIATTAVASYLVGKAPSALVVAQAAVHGYTVAFWWAAGIFAARRDRVRGRCCGPGWHRGGRRTEAQTGGGGMSTVVTISASYGAGGSWVGPQVAERLGWRFIDRAIPVQVAERLDVPVEHAHVHDEAAAPRFTRLLAQLPNTSGVVVPEATSPEFCRETERLLIEAADAGEVVVLGRAGAIVLGDRADAFHVRLDGPPEPRVFQAMRVEDVDEQEARRRQRNSDRARVDYVKHFYRTDPRDARHYHLVLDSTAVPLATCVELIVTAAQAHGS